MRVPKTRRTLIGVAALALLGSIPVIAAVTGSPATAAQAVPGDGTTSATAGASCWGIKAAFPASPNGVYWVLTSTLAQPPRRVIPVLECRLLAVSTGSGAPPDPQ